MTGVITGNIPPIKPHHNAQPTDSLRLYPWKAEAAIEAVATSWYAGV